MLGILKKKLDVFSNGFTDNHCHILPGVDDGFRRVEDSLAVLARYEKLGVKAVWFTPHIMEDVPNKPDELRARFEEFCEAYHNCPDCSGSLSLNLAAENMLDNLFLERLKARDLIPVHGDSLLVETSFFNPPICLRDTLSDIRQAGFFPLLAHPERYVYMDEEYYSLLKDDGVLFQLNLPSITGFYGENAKKKAEYLLRQGYYDCVGTDLHRTKVLDMLLRSRIDRKTAGYLKELLAKDK